MSLVNNANLTTELELFTSLRYIESLGSCSDCELKRSKFYACVYSVMVLCNQSDRRSGVS